MIAHAIQHMGYVFLRMVGVEEEEINEAQEFSAGFVSFAILLLIIACKPILWGRKARTDRVREGIPAGFSSTEQTCAFGRRGSEVA